MRDRVFLPLMALTAVVMIVLALVWPQGQGAPSPSPFGHPLASINESSAKVGKPPGTTDNRLEAAFTQAPR